MFDLLENINQRPELYSAYTADVLWTTPHISEQMLAAHLNETMDIASRRTEFIDRSVNWLNSRFSIGAGTRIADFGCGPGLYTTRFARTGAKVTGIDFSENSLKYAAETAQKENMEINYLHQNYLEYQPNQTFDLITMIFCDFCALNQLQRKQLLSVFYKALADNGSLVLDVFSLNAYEKRDITTTYAPSLMNGFWSADPYFSFLNTFKYDTEKVILDKYTIIEKTRTWEVYNWLKYFSLQTLKAEFLNSGFQIIEYYDTVAGAPHSAKGDEIAIIAQKLK